MTSAETNEQWEIPCTKCTPGKFTSWRSWQDNHGPYWVCTECDNYVFAAGLVPLLGQALIADHKAAAAAGLLLEALRDFDTHMLVSATYLCFQDLHRLECRKRGALWDVEFRNCGWFACKMARAEVDYLAKLHIRARAAIAAAEEAGL